MTIQSTLVPVKRSGYSLRVGGHRVITGLMRIGRLAEQGRWLSQSAVPSEWLATARAAQVLRTALVKPAMNSAANAQASSRNAHPIAVSQAGTPVTYTVSDQPGRYQLLPRVSKLESKI